MNKTSIIIAVVALIIAIAAFGHTASPVAKLGGLTNFDSLRIDSLGIGQDPATATGELVVKGSGTSTIAIAGTKGCLQLITTSGSTTAITVSGTSSPTVVATAGTCK